MPSFSSKSQLTPAVSSSGLVPFADIDLIRGAFKVYPSIGSLRGQPTALFTDSQIVFVKDTSKLYQCDYDTADNITVFADSMSFSEFTFSGGSSTDISSLNTFTGSIQTEVTTLTAATSSYLTSVPSGTISGSTQIGALGYITSAPSGTLSGSAQVETIIDDTYISASAALSGFGASGGGVGTLQQVTNLGTSTTVSMSIQGIEIFSAVETDGDKSGSIFIGGSVASRIKQLSNGTNTFQNTIIGFEAASGTNLLDSRNTVVGAAALKGVSGGDTNSHNTALGALSLLVLQDGGGGNTAIGAQSLVSLQSGSSIVAIGNDSGYNITSGSNSIFIGKRSNPANNISENEIVIGSWITGKGSNTVTIGNTDVTDNYFTGNITGSTDIYIAEWGSISASLATLTAGGGSSTDISSLNTFTGSIQTEVNTLTAATSSYLTSLPSGTISGSTQISGLGFLSSLPSGTVSGSTQITSVITDTYISASAAASGFGSGGGVSTDISSLNTFSGSIQTEVTALTQATASYLDNTNTILVEQSTPTAEAGGIYYSGSSFFVGIG